MSTAQRKTKRPKYPSDISNGGWKVIKKLLPKPKSNKKEGGRPPVDLREVVNGIFYVLKTGCSWRSLPHDLPNYNTVYGYFSRWSQAGLWREINSILVQKIRKRQRKKKGKVKSKRPSKYVLPQTYAPQIFAVKIQRYEKSDKGAPWARFLAR